MPLLKDALSIDAATPVTSRAPTPSASLRRFFTTTGDKNATVALDVDGHLL